MMRHGLFAALMLASSSAWAGQVVNPAGSVSPAQIKAALVGSDLSATLSTASGTTTPRSAASRGADMINVTDFGAVGDMAYQLNQYSTTAGGQKLVSVAPLFDQTWVGKTLILQGAGTGGSGLVTTVTAVADLYDLTMATPAATAIAATQGNGTPLYHLLSYGTDDTVAINNAIATAKTKYLSNNILRTYHSGLYFPARDYLVAGSINLTGIPADGFAITGTGARLHSAAVGQVAVDMIGSRYLRWEGPRITGEEYAPPTIGLQLGRNGDTTISADNHDFENLIVDGRFSLAAVLNENAETTTWNSVRISNDAPNAYAMIMDGVNHFRISSQFLTWTQPSESGQSFDENLFENPIFFTSGAGSTPLWIADAHRMRVVAGYAANTDTTAPIRVGTILYTAASTSIDQLDLDLHTESTTTDVIELTGPSSVTTINLEGLRLRDNAPFASNSIFKIDPSSAITSVTMPNADIDLHQITSVGQKLFDAPSAWMVSGSLYMPPGMLNPPGTFSGRLCSALTCDVGTSMVTAAGSSTAQSLTTVAMLANNALPQTGGIVSGMLTVGNALALPIVAKSVSFAFDSTMHTVTAAASAGPVIGTLPTCNGATLGRSYNLAKIDASSNAVSLASVGSDTISGNAMVSLTSQWGSLSVQCNGAGVWIRGVL